MAGLGLVTAVLATLLMPQAAVAAPGDASARGVVLALDASVLGVPVVRANETIGAADAPPGGGTDTDSNLAVGAGVGAIGTGAGGTVDEVTATRAALGSSASATVDDFALDVLGVTVVSTGRATAAVTCPLTGAQTAVTTLTGLTVVGTAETLEANAPPLTRTVGVAEPVAGLAGAALTVTVSRTETVTAGGATAVALLATLSLGGTVAGAPVVIPIGTVTIAQATCERPAAALAPTATGIEPDSGPVAGGQSVTIRGTNFVAGQTVVTFDGAAATDVVVAADGTSLTAVTPAGAAGLADVAVTTPGGTATLARAFRYIGAGVAPTLSALTPDSGPTAGGQTVVITGSGFVDGATTVTFDGVPATAVQVLDDDTLVVRTPPGAAGPADVVVTVSGADSGPLAYRYVAEATVPAAPVAADLSPDNGPIAGGTRVTVSGAGFQPGVTSVVICDTTLLPADVDVAADGRSLTITTPACAEGPTDLLVITPGGVADALSYTYTDRPTGPGNGGTLPNTGADTDHLALLGCLLIGLGCLLARQARRLPIA